MTDDLEDLKRRLVVGHKRDGRSLYDETAKSELVALCMQPGASVSGFYFWRPESQYFGLGRIGQDQVADYAVRKAWPLDVAERWLAPNLGYER